MGMQIAGARARPLHVGVAAAQGTDRELGLKSDFLQCVRQHGLQ